MFLLLFDEFLKLGLETELFGELGRGEGFGGGEERNGRGKRPRLKQ